MQYRTLGQTGLRVSILSYGASPLGGVFRDIDESAGVRAVQVALDRGVNFLDCSPAYGDTRAETVLGRALRQVARDRYYLATKVGAYGSGFDFSAARVTRSVEESMQRLGVDYIDVIQCHDIEYAEPTQIVEETLPALHALKAAGKVGHVGITGLPLTVLRRVLALAAPGQVETILSFCRYALNDDALRDLLPELRARGVGVINASATGMGLLTPRGAPDWHPAHATIQEGCRLAVAYCQEQGLDIVKLALQFAVANPAIATTLVGTANPENMARNLDYIEEPLDTDALAAVHAVLQPIHRLAFTRGLPQNHDTQDIVA